MRIPLDPAVLREIRAHALAALPAEACGAVFGRLEGGAARASRYRPLRNTADDPSSGFSLDGVELAAADRDARDAGLVLLGLFHSHPSGTTAPSAADRAADWPGRTVWIGAHDRDGRFRVRALPVVGARVGTGSSGPD